MSRVIIEKNNEQHIPMYALFSKCMGTREYMKSCFKMKTYFDVLKLHTYTKVQFERNPDTIFDKNTNYIIPWNRRMRSASVASTHLLCIHNRISPFIKNNTNIKDCFYIDGLLKSMEM